MQSHKNSRAREIGTILEIDGWARAKASSLIG